MGSYTIGAGKRAAHDKVLVASTVDTVTLTDDADVVEVITDGTAKVYVTVDGSTPAAGGDTTHLMPASSGGSVVREIPVSGDPGSIAVKLISAGTPMYSVTKLR